MRLNLQFNQGANTGSLVQAAVVLWFVHIFSHLLIVFWRSVLLASFNALALYNLFLASSDDLNISKKSFGTHSLLLEDVFSASFLTLHCISYASKHFATLELHIGL